MVNRPDLDVGNIHRILGIVMAFMFIGTGAYMHLEFDHLRNLDDAQRLLFRSVHIYLLLASLVNFALGIHYWVHPQKTFRLLQTIGSTLIGLSPVLFLLAFFNEPFLDGLQRPFSKPAVFAIAIGSLLHMIAWYESWLKRLKDSSSSDVSE